jgi:hypothetical protein
MPYAIDPQTGDLLEVGSETDIQALGYQPASAEQIATGQAAAAKREKFGTTGQEFATFGEKAASALTLGMSTAAERALGVSAEDIRARAEINPSAATAGTVAGIAAPLLITGGGTAPGAAAQVGLRGALRGAAEMTAPALISRLGRAATRTVAEAAPEAIGIPAKVIPGAIGAETGLLRQLAARAVATGVGSAVEGAAYGVGQVVEEAALGDPNLTAQSAIATVGLSAALGGAMGGAVGIAEGGIPAAVQKARDAAGSVLNSARGKFVEVYPAMAEKLAGVRRETVAEILEKRAEIFRDPKVRDQLARDMEASLQELYQTADDALRAANREIRPVEITELLTQAAPATEKAARQEYLRLHDQLVAWRNRMADDPALYPARFPAKLEQIREHMWKNYAADISPAQAFKTIDETKSLLDPLSRFGAIANEADRDAVALVKGLRSEFKTALENPAVWGEAGARQSAFNAAQSEQFAALKEMRAKFMQKYTTKTGAVKYRIDPVKVNSWIHQAGDLRGKARTEMVDRFVESTRNLTDQIEESAKNAPLAVTDRDALASVMGKTEGLHARVRKEAAASELLAQLQPRLAWGSSPVVSTAPAAGGFVEGIGALGAAPIIGSMIPGAGPIAAVYGAAKIAGAGVNLLANVPRTVAVLTALERATQSVTRAIDSGISAIMSSKALAQGFAVGRSEAAAGISRSFAAEPDEAQRQFTRRIEEVQRMAADPEAMHRMLMQATGQIDNHAPNTSQAMSVASARGIAFLATKIPPAPEAGLWSSDWKPSQAEIAKFNRYYEAVNKPLSILKQAATGTLTPEAIEAVSVVYPELMTKIRATAIAKAADHKKPPPYSSRMSLAMLLGHDIDGSMIPAAILANQASHAGPSAKSKENRPIPDLPKLKPNIKGLSKISMSKRSLTPMQRSVQRD